MLHSTSKRIYPKIFMIVGLLSCPGRIFKVKECAALSA